MAEELVKFVPASSRPNLDLATVAKSIIDQQAAGVGILKKLDDIVGSPKSQSLVARVFGRNAPTNTESNEFQTLALAIKQQMRASEDAAQSLQDIYDSLRRKQDDEDRLRYMRASSQPAENPLKPVLRRAFHAVRRLHPKLKCKLIGCDYCKLCDEIGGHLGANYLMSTNKVVEEKVVE